MNWSVTLPCATRHARCGGDQPMFNRGSRREPEGKERWLDATEIGKIEHVASPQWWALFAVLLYTGMRIGEAQGRCAT